MHKEKIESLNKKEEDLDEIDDSEEEKDKENI